MHLGHITISYANIDHNSALKSRQNSAVTNKISSSARVTSIKSQQGQRVSQVSQWKMWTKIGLGSDKRSSHPRHFDGMVQGRFFFIPWSVEPPGNVTELKSFWNKQVWHFSTNCPKLALAVVTTSSMFPHWFSFCLFSRMVIWSPTHITKSEY